MNISALQERVKLAQGELDEALAHGNSSFEARKKLKDAQSALNQAQRELDTEEDERNSKRAAKHRTAALQIIKNTETALSEEIAGLMNVQQPLFNLPIHLAANLLAARDAHEAATKAADEHQSRMNDLRSRLSEIHAERDKVVKRRAAGTRNDEVDGPRLALLQADSEGLQQLIDRETGNAPTSAAASANAVSQAQIALDAAINSERIRCLRDLVARYEAALIGTAKTLASIPGIRVTDRYQPCPSLRQVATTGVL